MNVYKIIISRNEDHLSKQFAVPSDMPLWALHYLINKYFAIDSSEPYSFAFMEDKFLLLAGKSAGEYKKNLGIWYMTPYRNMNEIDYAEEFDGQGDYEEWLEAKLKGPYNYYGHYQTSEDHQDDLDEFVTDYADLVLVSKDLNEYGYPSVRPIMDFEEYDEDEYDAYSFDELPIEYLPHLFDNNIDDLVETLTLEEIRNEAKQILYRDAYNRDIIVIEIKGKDDVPVDKAERVKGSYIPVKL